MHVRSAPSFVTVLVTSSIAAAQISYPVGAPVPASSDSQLRATISVAPGGPVVSSTDPKLQTNADLIAAPNVVAVAYPVTYHEANRGVQCGPNPATPNATATWSGEEDTFKVSGDPAGFVVDSYLAAFQGGWVNNNGTGVMLKTATATDEQSAARSIVVPFRAVGIATLYVDSFYSVTNVGPGGAKMQGYFKANWNLWKDVNADGKLDPAVDQVLDTGTLGTAIGDWIDPQARAIGIANGMFLLEVSEVSWSNTKYARPFCFGVSQGFVENEVHAILQIAVSW